LLEVSAMRQFLYYPCQISDLAYGCVAMENVQKVVEVNNNDVQENWDEVCVGSS